MANAVDRAVEHHRRHHAVETEARDQGRGLAVTVREPHPQPLAPGAAPMRPRHGRRRPGLVDEHQPRRVQIGLGVEPRPAPPQDVRAVLLDRALGLFFRVTPWRWTNRDRAEVDAETPRSARRAQSSSRL